MRILEQELLGLLAQDGRFDMTIDRCLQLMETTQGQLNKLRTTKAISKGVPGEGKMEREYAFVLRDRFIQISNKAVYGSLA